MSRHSNYSREFKEAIVSKIINRGNKTVSEVWDAEGVNKGTAISWLRSIGTVGMNKKSKKWTSKEKLKAISDTTSSSEAELGAYLRKEGLHSQQLKDWRDQALSSLEATPKSPAVKDERDEMIKQLEKEILRKDKALTEASALLILQKKVSLIWGDREPK